MSPVWETTLAILASLGLGGGTVAAFSGWLGKLWANRLMEKHSLALEQLRADLTKGNEAVLAGLRSDLEITKTKILAAHQDKVTHYQHAIEVLIPIVVFADNIIPAKASQPEELNALLRQFEVNRLRAYAHLAMFAPQTVMDAHDRLSDYVMDVVDERQEFAFSKIRTLGIDLINSIRTDLGIDTDPIHYSGSRQ